MEHVFGFLSSVFWGVLLLSALVFVHEGGHYLASRACGVRVTEFMLGLPSRFAVSIRSKRGTRFGVTPLLLGGYAAVCGMDPEVPSSAARVLGAVHRHGTVSVDALADELEIDAEEALESCVFLMGWGSVSPVFDESKGERPTSKFYPSTYAAEGRDASGNTAFDGRAFDRDHATAVGEAWVPPMDDDAFFLREQARTYRGKGFWPRALILLAGILVNILSGVLLMIGVYSGIGIDQAVDVNAIGSITDGSPAERAGIGVGDRIVAVDGVEVQTWMDVLDQLEDDGAGDTVKLDVWSAAADAEPMPLEPIEAADLSGSGEVRSIEVTLDDEGMLGIGVSYTKIRLSPIDSVRMAGSFVAATAEGVAQLLVPTQTMEVLDNSTSIVGISAMASDAANDGLATFLNFAALISFSLGFMNLLPIPPLDGGKLVLEAIEAVLRRPVSVRVQTILSYIGIGLFGLLFLYMLRADILRLL